LWTLLIDFFAYWDIAQDEGSPREEKTSLSRNHKSLATPPQTSKQAFKINPSFTMPPKTEEMQELAVVHTGEDDSISIPYSPCSSTVSTTGSGLKRQDSCCFSFVELQQPSLLSEGGNVAEAFETSLGFLSLRVKELTARTLEAVQSLENPDEDSSPVLKACTMSLHSRVPLLLKQASLLIHQLKCQPQSSSSDDNDDDESNKRIVIGRLRSNFALVRLVQYLDLIESAMQNPPRELLDVRLLEILKKASHPLVASSSAVAGEGARPFFRVSPWLAKTLAFDLPIGQTASTRLLPSSADKKNLPLEVEVEPMFEIHAADIVAGKLENCLSFCSCSVVIESCKHKATPFSSGAGMIGECIIRVHLTPLQYDDDKKQGASSSASRATWDEAEPEKLVVREARAVQTNAYPPKPKANVDLYTSHLYGDAGITVTMIIKTSVTENSTAAVEVPKLHIELFLAPLSVKSA
jgi:hypothetical protein